MMADPTTAGMWSANRQILSEGWDAVFGSRFVRGGGVIDYPRHKLLLNRMANLYLRLMFGVPLNDFTNAFKAYRRSVIEGCRPFLSPHFNLTVELPLKTIVRGYSWTMVPITWRNRSLRGIETQDQGDGHRYLFIALYCWLEKYFSRGIPRKVTFRRSTACANLKGVTAISRQLSTGERLRLDFERLATPRFASAAVLVIVLWEIAVLGFKASSLPFWYDELLTFHISGLRPFSLFWRALWTGADGMPPGYYAFVLAARMFPGDPQVILRLPSILGYILTLLGAYWFTSRRLSPAAGLTAVVLTSLSPFRFYATDARPYALEVGLLAISAVCWQRIGEKRFMTPLFAVSLGLAVGSHYLAVAAIAAFGAAELTGTILSRRIRWGVWTACLLASAPFLAGVPLLLQVRSVFGKHFWAHTQWGMVLTSYEAYLGLDLELVLVLIVFFVLAAGESLTQMWQRPGEGSPKSDFSPPELVLAAGLLLYPALLVVLSKMAGAGYAVRYGVPGVLGLVLAAAYLSRFFHRTSANLVAAMLIVFVLRGARDLKGLPREVSVHGDEPWIGLSKISRTQPDIPVVIGNGLRYLSAARYAPPDLRGRLYDVVDMDNAVRVVGTDSVDQLTGIVARFIPLQVQDLASFEAAHPKFILYSGGFFDWITQYLIEKNYHLQLRSREPGADSGYSIYVVER